MRLDDADARTWLLGGAAGWALLGWLLALAGMAGHVTLLPDDAGLLRPLPPVRPPAAQRLGPLAQYDQIAARPLFSPDRRPHPFSLQPEGQGEAAAAAFDYVLTSVLITPRLQLAMLQSPDGSESARVRVGEAPERTPGWRLVTLNPRSAVFEGPEGQRTLDLRVFDGKGGATPTTATGAAGMPGDVSPGGSGMAAPGTSVPIVPSGPPAIPRPPEIPIPQSPSAPAPAAPVPSNADAASEQAQMEAIRQRIQARREQQRLMQQSQNK